MLALVTGVAGFIGSHLAASLATTGWQVRGLDAFTPYYDLAQKRANFDAAAEAGVECAEGDVQDVATTGILNGVDVVFHQAAQPGVRDSWDEFEVYTRHNLVATQRLLEAAHTAGVRRVVYASSSSIYGDVDRFPVTEEDLPRPYSPYGVTKLAGEHLCSAYAQNYGLDVVMLRYFTVYGPRQRPDMAIHRLIECALHGGTFPLYGDGGQIREFTHVDDIVRANLAAATAAVPTATAVNVSGGAQVALRDLIEHVGRFAGTHVQLDRRPAQPGDVRRTGGSSDRALGLLGWKPEIGLEQGLADQIAWHRSRVQPDGS